MEKFLIRYFEILKSSSRDRYAHYYAFAPGFCYLIRMSHRVVWADRVLARKIIWKYSDWNSWPPLENTKWVCSHSAIIILLFDRVWSFKGFCRCRDSNPWPLDKNATRVRYHCATFNFQQIESRQERYFEYARPRTWDLSIGMLLDCATTALHPLFKPIESSSEEFFSKCHQLELRIPQ